MKQDKQVIKIFTMASVIIFGLLILAEYAPSEWANGNNWLTGHRNFFVGLLCSLFTGGIISIVISFINIRVKRRESINQTLELLIRCQINLKQLEVLEINFHSFSDLNTSTKAMFYHRWIPVLNKLISLFEIISKKDVIFEMAKEQTFNNKSSILKDIDEFEKWAQDMLDHVNTTLYDSALSTNSCVYSGPLESFDGKVQVSKIDKILKEYIDFYAEKKH